MPAQVRRNEAAPRHDAQTSRTRILQTGPGQPRSVSPSLKRRRDGGVCKHYVIAAEEILENRQLPVEGQFEPALRFVVYNARLSHTTWTRHAGYNAVHMRVFPVLLACSAVFAATPALKSAFDKPVFEDYVRHLLAVTNSEVKVSVDDPKPSPIPGLKEVDVHLTYGPASQDIPFYVSADGRHVVRGEIFNINQSPFQAALAALKPDGAPAYGAGPGAPITIVVFSDFECPLCKDEALSLRKNVVADFPDKVRVYFKDFPLSSIHPWAAPAAIAGHCMYQLSPAAFWQYHDWLYENQADITIENFMPKVEEFAKSKGLDLVRFGACLQDRAADEKALNAEIAEGKALGIDKTPTIFVNGRKLEGNIPWDGMKMLIQYELDYQKTHPASAAAASNEKCCEVTIPTATGK